MRKIIGALRRAVNDFNMIEDGDHIVIGVSGGKDSVALIKALAEYQKYAKINFKLSAVTVDVGFEKAGYPVKDKEQTDALSQFIQNLGVDYYVVETNIAEIVFKERKEKNPCSLCSKIRRGTLCTKCVELGANKLALGHHSEDVLETFMLSFLYEGRLSTLQPYSYMDRTGITLIRPFIYVKEADIKGAVKRHEMPLVKNPCPVDKLTQRQYMKDLTKSIQKDIPFAKDRMMVALMSPDRYNLWDKCQSLDKDKEE